jgi:hypothetical protein
MRTLGIPECYVAVCRGCGNCPAIICNLKGREAETAEFVVDIVRGGNVVEACTLEEGRQRFSLCSCIKRPQPDALWVVP